MKYRGNLKEKAGSSGDVTTKAPKGEKFLAGGEVEVRDDKFRAPKLEGKTMAHTSGKNLVGKFPGKAMTGRGGGGKGKKGFSAAAAAAILGKRC